MDKTTLEEALCDAADERDRKGGKALAEFAQETAEFLKSKGFTDAQIAELLAARRR